MPTEPTTPRPVVAALTCDEPAPSSFGEPIACCNAATICREHFDAARQATREAERERDGAEGFLMSKGYRKSCDIPACNCGDQWAHGGYADRRLQEISDALGEHLNGRTFVGAIDQLRAQLAEAERELAKQPGPSRQRFKERALGGDDRPMGSCSAFSGLDLAKWDRLLRVPDVGLVAVSADDLAALIACTRERDTITQQLGEARAECDAMTRVQAETAKQLATSQAANLLHEAQHEATEAALHDAREQLAARTAEVEAVRSKLIDVAENLDALFEKATTEELTQLAHFAREDVEAIRRLLGIVPANG